MTVAGGARDPLTEFSIQLDVLNGLAQELRHDHRSRPLRGAPITLLPPEDASRAYTELIRDVRVEVRSTTRMPLVGAPMWRQTTQVTGIVRTGRKWRDIFDAEAVQVDGVVQHLHDIAFAGAESRTLPKVPFKLAIADENVALIGVPDGPDKRIHTLRIGRCGVLGEVIDLFETLWTLATPMAAEAVAGPDATASGETDHELLRLLAAGATDEAIARQLQVSLRTVQRRVRKLEDMLGARTRFQAGIQAARRHLI